VFDLVREYAAHFDPKTTEELTWAPAAAVESLARTSPQEPGTTLFAVGMGPNQFFNNDNKDRDIFLLAALTGNVGKIGGNVGSYAGNYRVGPVQRRAAVHQREPVRPRAGSGQAGPAAQYWRPSRRTTTTTRTTRCGRQPAADRRRRTCRRRPSRCGSPTPTRSWATSSGTTTRWSTCCRGSR
jgi:anaerobic selenocysteine-containing dehydrogenase